MSDIKNPGDQNPGENMPGQTGQDTNRMGDADRTSETGSFGYDQLKRRAGEELEQVQHVAEEQARRVAEKAGRMATEQMGFAARQLCGVASAIERVGEELENRNQPTAGRYTREFGRGMQKIASDLEHRDMRELAGVVEDFGRKQPVAFLSAAALAGFAASRFLVASSERRRGPGQSGTENLDPDAASLENMEGGTHGQSK